MQRTSTRFAHILLHWECLEKVKCPPCGWHWVGFRVQSVSRQGENGGILSGTGGGTWDLEPLEKVGCLSHRCQITGGTQGYLCSWRRKCSRSLWMGVLSFSAEFIKRKQANKIRHHDFISFIRKLHVHLLWNFTVSEAQTRTENLGTAPSTKARWQRDT